MLHIVNHTKHINAEVHDHMIIVAADPYVIRGLTIQTPRFEKSRYVSPVRFTVPIVIFVSVESSFLLVESVESP